MNPKQEAQCLIEQIQDQSLLSTVTMPSYLIVECAILTTESHIAEINFYNDLKSVIFIFDKQYSVVDRLVYWQEVKTELEAMR